MEDENNKLAIKLTAESQKCDLLYSGMKTSKVENSNLNRRLKMVISELDIAKALLNIMNTRSRKLDNIMCSQKVHTDKHGIGYPDEASTSNAQGINCFVKNSVITNIVVSVAHRDPKKKNVSRPEQSPSCYHCRIKRHIRPHSNKLRSLPNQK